ncbi:fimbrial protein [Enterobacter kobei]
MADEVNVPIRLSGTLIESPPCVIRPGDDEITLAFSEIEMKRLKEQKRTDGHPFTIHLDNCDISVPGTVKVSFIGLESAGSPGLLMPDRSSISDGIAIGIETPAGELLGINDPTKYLSLQLEESIAVALQAFVQVDDENKLTEGNFYASANYLLEYE